jgi:hypothetical protein
LHICPYGIQKTTNSGWIEMLMEEENSYLLYDYLFYQNSNIYWLFR